jgi:hypothetical protein
MASLLAGEEVKSATGFGEFRHPVGFPRKVGVERAAFDDEGREVILSHHIFEVSDEPDEGLLIALHRSKFIGMLISNRVKKRVH